MSKKEFLDTLRSQLEGELSQNEINGHIRYYRDYIEQQMRSGKSEQQVLDELGSPVFIAKTLLDTSAHTYEGSGYEDRGYESREDDYEREEECEGKVHTFHFNPLVARWLIPIVVAFVLVLGFALFGTALAFVIRYFVPILAILLVISIFKNNRR